MREEMTERPEAGGGRIRSIGGGVRIGLLTNSDRTLYGLNIYNLPKLMSTTHDLFRISLL